MLNSYGHFIIFFVFLLFLVFNFLSINCHALLIIFAWKRRVINF